MRRKVKTMQKILEENPDAYFDKDGSLSGLNNGDYKHLTSAEYTDLTDAGDSAAHYHSTDRNLANATGTLAGARFDDTSHGTRSGGTLHADVIAGGADGFMTGADKTKLDTYQSSGDSYIRSDAADIVNANTTWTDSSQIQIGTDADMILYRDGTVNRIRTDDGNIVIQSGMTEVMAQFVPNGAVTLYYDDSSKLATNTSGVTVTGTLAATTVTGANVTSGSDPGHTHTSYLAAGGTAVNAALLDSIDSSQFIRSDAADTVSANTTWGDSNEVQLGASSDFRFYHNGTNNYINSANGSLYLYNGGNSEIMAILIPNGAVELYYDGVKKIETTSAGATVTGDFYATGTIDGGQL